MSHHDAYAQADLAAGIADALLAEAQLIKPKDNVLDLANIAGGYANLAIARQLAALTETVEALAERVQELTGMVAATRARRARTSWWWILLPWRPERRAAVASFGDVTETVSPAARGTSHGEEAEQGAAVGAADESLAAVIDLRFAGGAR